jgi:hypothetical protein
MVDEYFSEALVEATNQNIWGLFSWNQSWLMIVSLVVNLPCIYHENLASLAIDTPMFIGVYAVLTQEQRIFGYPSGIWILYSFVLFYCPHCQIFIGFYLHILAKLNQGFKLFSSPFVVEVIPPCQLMLHQFTGTFLILRVLIRVTPYIIYAYMFIYIYTVFIYNTMDHYGIFPLFGHTLKAYCHLFVASTGFCFNMWGLAADSHELHPQEALQALVRPMQWGKAGGTHGISWVNYGWS